MLQYYSCTAWCTCVLLCRGHIEQSAPEVYKYYTLTACFIVHARSTHLAASTSGKPSPCLARNAAATLPPLSTNSKTYNKKVAAVHHFFVELIANAKVGAFTVQKCVP
jgi:hypothetical protein